MEGNKDDFKVEKIEDLTQVLEVINAKGDTGEIEDVLEDPKVNDSSRTKIEGNDVLCRS